MVYIGVITHNPFTNLLLTSWDIQVPSSVWTLNHKLPKVSKTQAMKTLEEQDPSSKNSRGKGR